MTAHDPAVARIALPPVIDPRSFYRRDPSRPIVELEGGTMGTTWRVRLVAPAGLDTTEIHAAVTTRLEAIIDEMSHWAPASLLCGFNRAVAGSQTSLTSDFNTVMATALDIARRSNGAFDPAIGRLVDLWGFGPPGAVATPPGDDMIAAARVASGWRLLDHDEQARRLRQPGGLALDLSGIAKGFAVDAVLDLLKARAIDNCLVEVGGELAGYGIRPDGEPWWVDLELPPGVDLPPFRVALHGLAIATSGNYLRGDHNLDPRSGRPARNGMQSVSVVHRSAMHADAWATALTVLGPDDGPALAQREGLAARMIALGPAGVTEQISPALLALLAD